MCRSPFDPRRKRWIQTMRPNGIGSHCPDPLLPRRAEDLLELVRSRDLELIVAAVRRPFVVAPALKDRGVTESRPLHVVVLHLAHPFDAERLPRKILARAPAALAPR